MIFWWFQRAISCFVSLRIVLIFWRKKCYCVLFLWKEMFRSISIAQQIQYISHIKFFHSIYLRRSLRCCFIFDLQRVSNGILAILKTNKFNLMQLSASLHTNPTYFISVKIIKYRWIVDLILGINFTFTNYQLMRFFLCVENWNYHYFEALVTTSKMTKKMNKNQIGIVKIKLIRIISFYFFLSLRICEEL